jgi:glycosyltransferase involved in cell wall biosynthesis
LLYVGRISKEKDLDVLAQAYRQLCDEGLPIQLYLVGDGPYLQALHKAMPEAIFTGYLRGKELAAAYASADVFVFPSTTDTFGNVVIEAQASGVPVIVSDTGGPKELVEENVNGVVTKSHDVEDLARAIRDLVNDKRKRHQMSRQARQAVIDRSWPGAFRKFWAATEI